MRQQPHNSNRTCKNHAATAQTGTPTARQQPKPEQLTRTTILPPDARFTIHTNAAAPLSLSMAAQKHTPASTSVPPPIMTTPPHVVLFQEAQRAEAELQCTSYVRTSLQFPRQMYCHPRPLLVSSPVVAIASQTRTRSHAFHIFDPCSKQQSDRRSRAGASLSESGLKLKLTRLSSVR